MTTKDFVLDAIPRLDGQLEVTSTPAGAKIFINGIDTNNVTPYTFTKAPGEYSVYVTLSGYVTRQPRPKLSLKMQSLPLISTQPDNDALHHGRFTEWRGDMETG